MTEQVNVFVEAGASRVFASALDWPGWARSGRTEQAALDALAGYRPRYEPVVRRAGLMLARAGLVVTERHQGHAKNADFGALGEIATAERTDLTAAEGERLAALLTAAWAELDRAAAAAPERLRKGPRGGGRDRDQILQHVIDAEAMFARKIGIAPGKPALASPAAVAAMRGAITTAIAGGSAAEPAGQKGWPVRYAVRRIGWHVLDHAWEIEDKSEPAQAASATAG